MAHCQLGLWQKPTNVIVIVESCSLQKGHLGHFVLNYRHVLNISEKCSFSQSTPFLLQMPPFCTSSLTSQSSVLSPQSLVSRTHCLTVPLSLLSVCGCEKELVFVFTVSLKSVVQASSRLKKQLQFIPFVSKPSFIVFAFLCCCGNERMKRRKWLCLMRGKMFERFTGCY